MTMTMTVVFEDYEDMMNFAKKVMGQAVSSDNASQRPTAESILGITPETFTTASSLQVPVTPPLVQQAPITSPPVQQPAPAATVTPPVQPVATTTPRYTLDDLMMAAIPLMDSGKQSELLQLIRSFGVEALPFLQPEQYGAFATALRGLGAQI